MPAFYSEIAGSKKPKTFNGLGFFSFIVFSIERISIYVITQRLSSLSGYGLDGRSQVLLLSQLDQQLSDHQR